MLTSFMVIQVVMNMALIVCLVRLLREREVTARAAREREERLEALAAELCTVGHQVTRQAPADRPQAASVPAATQPAPPAPRAEPMTRRGADGGQTVDRFRGAATLLAQGVTIDQVAAETALLPGELAVLRNLRRTPGRTDARRQLGEATPVAAIPAVRRAAHRTARRASV